MAKNSRAKSHARRQISRVQARAITGQPGREAVETAAEETAAQRRSPTPRRSPALRYVLVVDPDSDVRGRLIAGLRAGREPGHPEDDQLPIRAAATLARAAELLTPGSRCAALICGPGVATVDASQLLARSAQVGTRLGLLVGSRDDRERQAAASEQLAVYVPHPADPATLCSLSRRLLDDEGRTRVHAHIGGLELTPRQRELLLVGGLRAGEICAHLETTHSTYRKHVASMLAATGFQRSSELLASFERGA